MNFKERSNNFQIDVEKLQKKYGIQLYATQTMLENGDIVILIKLRDMLPPEKEVETPITKVK